MKQLAALFAVIALVSLQESSFAGGRGGLDGGGGHVRGSTREQVYEALQRSFRLAVWSEKHQSIFEKYIHSRTYDFLKPGAVRAKLFQLKGKVASSKEEDFKRVYDSQALRAFSQNKIEIRQHGDCGRPEDNHADASVSSLTLDGDICFSVENLMKIAPEALMREILSLIFHEAVHLAGGGEREAQRWQLNFHNYFDQHFSLITPVDYGWRAAGILRQAMWRIKTAIDLQAKAPNTPLVYLLLGQIVDLPIPYAYSPDAVELIVNPPRPWLIPNYTNSVQALKANIEARLGAAAKPWGNSQEQNEGLANIQLPKDKALADWLKEIRDGIDILEDNMEAMMGQEPPKNIRCIQFEDPAKRYTCAEDQAPIEP